MRRALRRIAAVLLVALAITHGAPMAAADSIFASTGFGRWSYPVDARSVALGNVSIVGSTRFGFSPRNPALMAYLASAAGHASVVSEFTRVDAGRGRQTRSDAALPLLGVGVPLGAGIVGSVFSYPLTDARYELVQQVAGEPDYDLHLKGEGGWTQIAAGLARTFRAVALGVHVGLPFTGADEEIRRTFAGEDFRDRDEHLETNLDDVFFVTFGAHAVTGALSVGGFVQLPATGTVTSRRVARGVVSSESFELGIPPAFGGGLAFALPGNLRLLGEYRRHPWSSAEIDGASWRELPEPRRGFEDQDAYGAGLEWQRRRRQEAVSRAPIWRLGFGMEPWIVAGPSFGRVTDMQLSAGMGIPFREGNGILDLAVRYTRRRESGATLREDVVGVVLGLGFARQPREF